MIFYNEADSSYDDRNWIYIGGDINVINWSKVGKTTDGLITRHRSPQNPGYFIYAAFQIIRGSVHEIEDRLKKHLEWECNLKSIAHFSTGNPSECFRLNPDKMSYLVEDFIQDKFGSCVTYENNLNGDMSRYQCSRDIRRHFQDDAPRKSNQFIPQPCSLGRKHYFSGNQETYETDLGDDHYLDHTSGMITHRVDDK